MNKEEFLKLIGSKGYDVGFGAKKNFASFDMICKLPTWVAIISFAIAVTQLAYPEMPFQKPLSILLLIASSAIIYLELFKSKKDSYEIEGIRLTKKFNKLKELFLEAKSDNNFNYQIYSLRYNDIMNDFYEGSITQQIFMSQWYAHYKLFFETEYQWVEDARGRKFSFFKDKMPASLSFSLGIIVIIILIFVINGYI